MMIKRNEAYEIHFRGIRIWEHITGNTFFKHNSAYGEAMRAVSRNEKKLLARLGGEEKTLFEKYVDAQGEVNQLTAVSNLVYGYKLGLLMTAEAFITSEDLIVDEEAGTL